MQAGHLKGLELGSSAFELVEFSLDRRLATGIHKKGVYGVNVEKVREVVRMPKINPLASSHPCIAGVFELRGIPIPAVNLARVLGDQDAPVKPDQQIIVTEFSHKRAGFIVSHTNRIRRIQWERVLPPASDAGTCINGMALIEDNEFLFILDLERILLDIEGLSADLLDLDRGASVPLVAPSGLVMGAQRTAESPALNGRSILLVDDSKLILNNARSFLERDGYRVTVASNGLEGQEILEKSLQSKSEQVDLVVTDVEMPKMDGITFTKWIRSIPEFSQLPVILHTSLSGRNTQEAGILVGANGYVVKNNARELLELVGEILGTRSA